HRSATDLLVRGRNSHYRFLVIQFNAPACANTKRRFNRGDQFHDAPVGVAVIGHSIKRHGRRPATTGNLLPVRLCRGPTLIAAEIAPFFSSWIGRLTIHGPIFPERPVLADKAKLHHSSNRWKNDDFHFPVTQNERVRPTMVSDIGDRNLVLRNLVPGIVSGLAWELCTGSRLLLPCQ